MLRVLVSVSDDLSLTRTLRAEDIVTCCSGTGGLLRPQEK